MLLFTAAAIKHHRHSNTVQSERIDNGTCFNCKRQGTGDLLCRTCTRNQYAKEKIKDFFEKRS